MKITLSTQKKECFEVDVELSTTVLDLKRMLVEHLGLPEESISKISIVFKQIIISNNDKTLFDLDVTEGSKLFFFVPAKFTPMRSSSAPSPKVINQKPELSADKTETEPKVEIKETPAAPQNPDESETSKEPQEKELRPSPEEPPISTFFSDPNESDFNFNQPKYNIDPANVEKLKEMGFDERHATVFLIASSNDLNTATNMITTPFYQDERNFERLERLVNRQMDNDEIAEFTQEVMASAYSKSGYNNKPQPKQTTQNKQAAQMLQLLATFAQVAKAAQEAKMKKQRSVGRTASGPSPMLNPGPLSQAQQASDRRQMIQQQLQQITDLYKQRSQQRNQSLQNNLTLFQLYAAALKEVQQMCKTRPDFFSNPFVEIKQMMINQNMQNDGFIKYILIAEKLDKDQMMFVSEQMNCGKRFEEILSILDATEGNIESAREILNSQ